MRSRSFKRLALISFAAFLLCAAGGVRAFAENQNAESDSAGGSAAGSPSSSGGNDSSATAAPTSSGSDSSGSTSTAAPAQPARGGCHSEGLVFPATGNKA